MNIIFKVKSRHEESDYAVLNLIPIICTENEATYETSGHGVFVTVPKYLTQEECDAILANLQI